MMRLKNKYANLLYGLLMVAAIKTENAAAEDAAENAAAEEGEAEEQNDHEQNSADGGNADGGAPAGKLYGMAFGFTNLLAAALGGQEWACIGLGAACLILGVVDIVLAVKKFRKAKAEPLPEPEIAEEPVAEIAVEEAVAVPVEEPVMAEPAEEPVMAEPVIEEIAEELPEEEEEEDLAAFDEPDEENVTAEEEQRFLALAGLHAGSAWFRYNYSFLAKLALADDAVKEQYASLAEEFSYWNKVKTRTSWKQERVYSGRKNIALVFFRGRKLCVAFALDPAEFAETKYRGTDVSETKRFAATPMMLRITSPRKLKYAIYLFGVAASRLGLERGESGQGKPEVRTAAKEELIAEGLIRINVVHRGDGTTKTVDFGQFMHGIVTAEPDKAEEAAATETPAEEVIATTEPEAENAEETPVAEMRELLIQQQREFVSAAVAHESLSDETAILLYENDSKTSDSEINGLKRSKRAEVNVDTLSAKFAAYETVTLQKMKERGIVPAGTQAVKILARGILGKPLYVEAQDFSVDAVKMILLTGGKATRVPAETPSDRRG